MIGADHLTAALAFWDYSRRSAEFIFGTSGTAAGDPVADKIERALRELGPTKRSDVYSNVIQAESLRGPNGAWVCGTRAGAPGSADFGASNRWR